MKKLLKVVCALCVPLLAVFAIYDYYWTLPVEGSYETQPIEHSIVERTSLKTRLSLVDSKTLEQMKHSGMEVFKWQNMLSKVNSNVISEVVPESDPFFVKEHYPYDEVFDPDTQSLYYYHSHRPGEHGHFHLFYCDPDVLAKYEPQAIWGKKNSSVHLLAISIHPDGTPLSFFTTNQWITPKEWWYSAEHIKEFVSQFEITHAYPSWPTNQWVTHMLRLFKPQIEDLLTERDEILGESGLPLEKALRNRKIDVISQVPISVELQLEVIDEILKERDLNQETVQ